MNTVCKLDEPDEPVHGGEQRVLKLARTIADLARCEQSQSVHLAETLRFGLKMMLGQAVLSLNLN